MKKSSANNLLNNSRTSQNQNVKQSRLGAGKQSRISNMASKGQLIVNMDSTNNNNAQQKNTYENTISHLKNIIAKEKKKVKDLKNLYMR